MDAAARAALATLTEWAETHHDEALGNDAVYFIDKLTALVTFNPNDAER